MLDHMARPDALFTAATGAVKRNLIAAFFSRIWVDDDRHQPNVAREFQPLARTDTSTPPSATQASR